MSQEYGCLGSPGEALFLMIFSVDMFISLALASFPDLLWAFLLGGVSFVFSLVLLLRYLWKRHKNGCTDRWGPWQVNKSFLVVSTAGAAVLSLYHLFQESSWILLWFYVFLFSLSLVFLLSRLWYDHRRKKKRASESPRSDD